MSGRGVMTSRTSVSPKSTTDRSSRLSSARGRVVVRRGDGRVAGRAVSPLRRGRRSAGAQPADDQRRQRPDQVGDQR